MKKLLVLLVVGILMVSVNSCKKYQDGPLISLRSKTTRIVNDWVIDKVMSKGVDATSLYPEDYLLSIKDDLTYSLLFNGFTQEGTWVFDDKKENIIFTLSTTGMESKFFILRLKNKELTLEQTVNDEKYTFYYVQKPD